MTAYAAHRGGPGGSGQVAPVAARVLVAYASRAGTTRSLGEQLAEALRREGCEVDCVDAATLQVAGEGTHYDAYVLGSGTYHGEMLAAMKRLLFILDGAGLKGRVGGAFGTYGWSGEAPQRIFDTMGHILGLRMVAVPLRVKEAAGEGVAAEVRAFAGLLAVALAGRVR